MKKNLSYRIVLFLSITLFPNLASAQNWKSVLSGIASSVGEKVTEKVSEKVDVVSFVGQWAYVKPDCRFESENLLSKAGGEVASLKVEEHMSKVLSKIGIVEGTSFSFEADSTYSIVIGKRTLKGNYSYNKETKELTLTSKLKMHFTAKLSMNALEPDKMSLLFDADKLMSFVKNITGTLANKYTNKTITSANAMLSKFEGLMLGLELQKK